VFFGAMAEYFIGKLLSVFDLSSIDARHKLMRRLPIDEALMRFARGEFTPAMNQPRWLLSPP